MQLRFRSVLLALVAVAALGGSAAASASAHEFVSSKTGALTDPVTTPVEFQIGESLENVKCNNKTPPSGTGTVTELKRKTLIVAVTYPDCFWTGVPFKLRSFTAEWEVSAEGHMKLLKTFQLETPTWGPPCKWNVVPSAGEESTVAFSNSSPVKTVTAVRASKHMKEELASPGECGKANESTTWSETFTLGTEGGTLQWK